MGQRSSGGGSRRDISSHRRRTRPRAAGPADGGRRGPAEEGYHEPAASLRGALLARGVVGSRVSGLGTAKRLEGSFSFWIGIS